MENKKEKKEPQEFIVETPVFIEETIIKKDGKIVKRKYERGKFLGKGGFAKCYEIKCLETKTNYAAKLFPKKELQNQKSKKKLINEIKLHKKLKHQNIVNFEHFFEDSENVYILLELCPNQTLNDLLKRRKRLTELEVQYYIFQMISALRYIHNHKIMHRDLKLGNCFLSANMEAKIGDFGLSAKLEFEGQKRKTVCGTPNYIAPEILEKKGHSYEVDVWSLGVVFYTLLFGRPPFETNEVKQTYKKIKMNTFTFPDYVTLHSSTKDLITSIFVLDPAKRPSLDWILNHDFFKIFNTIPRSVPSLTLACPPSYNFMIQFIKNDGNSSMTHMLKNFNQSVSALGEIGSNNALNQNISSLDIKIIENQNHKKSESLINLPAKNINLNNENNQDQFGERVKSLLSGKKVNSRNENQRGKTLNVNKNNTEYKRDEINPLNLISGGSINNNIVNNNFFINVGSLNSLELKIENNLIGTINSKRNKEMNSFDYIKITKYYDYSSKFGMVYLLSNQSLGIIFQDNSNLVKVLSENNTKKGKLIFIEQEGKKELILDHHQIEYHLNNTNTNQNKNFSKKISVFTQVFNKYKNELSENKKSLELNNETIFVKNYVKNNDACLFRLSNKIIHVFFTDKSELIFSTKGVNNAVYIDKNGEEIQDSIENLMNSENLDVLKKIRNSKIMLMSLIKK